MTKKPGWSVRELIGGVWRSWVVRWLLLIAAVGFGIAWFRSITPDANWQVAISGISAVASLAAVATTATFAWQANRRVDQADETQRSERERVEARNVSWWVSRVSGFDEPHPRLEDRGFIYDDESAAEWSPSKAIVPFAIFCEIVLRNNNANALSAGVLSPTFPCGAGPMLIGVIPPGDTRLVVFVEAPTPSAAGFEQGRMGLNRGAEWIEFRDTSGRYWRRMADQSLVLQSTPVRPGDTTPISY